MDDYVKRLFCRKIPVLAAMVLVLLIGTLETFA